MPTGESRFTTIWSDALKSAPFLNLSSRTVSTTSRSVKFLTLPTRSSFRLFFSISRSSKLDSETLSSTSSSSYSSSTFSSSSISFTNCFKSLSNFYRMPGQEWDRAWVRGFTIFVSSDSATTQFTSCAPNKF